MLRTQCAQPACTQPSHLCTSRQQLIASSKHRLKAGRQDTVGRSMLRERVTFPNEAGHTLVGILTCAAHSSSRSVILCHGYLNNKDSFHLAALAERLAAEGFNSLRFDFRGNEDSQGAFGFGNYWEEVQDIAAAKRFLEEQHQQTVVALVGHSKGGDDVILYASKHGDIPVIVNISGRFWLEKGVAQRFGENFMERLEAGPMPMTSKLDDGSKFEWQLTKQDVKARMAIDMRAAAAAITGCNVLTIHGSDDRTISVDDGQEFAAVIQGSELHVVQGADHNFTGHEHAQEMIEHAVRFIVDRASDGSR